MSLYATPKIISDPASCDFYHVVDIPGIGLRGGQWDLRKTVKEYLGNYDFKGKRVLEIGTGTGFLCFHMESQGADVVAYDVGRGDAWDFLFGPDENEGEVRRNNALACQRLNNGFWLCHKAFSSRAKMVNGTAYDIPAEFGWFDVVTLCSVLLHLRDPLRALQRAVPMARDAIIITDLMV
jgi:SAM-dependent methyltransferase